MFEKKVVAEINYDAMFGQEIVRSLERIEDLGEEDKKAGREIELKTLEWDNDMSASKRKLLLMKGELAALKAKVVEIKYRFTGIVNELRLTATSEELDRMKSRIENFDYEKFITRKDFLELISRKH
jgi:hypothetical protein